MTESIRQRLSGKSFHRRNHTDRNVLGCGEVLLVVIYWRSEVGGRARMQGYDCALLEIMALSLCCLMPHSGLPPTLTSVLVVQNFHSGDIFIMLDRR